MLEIAKNGEEAIRILEKRHMEVGAATDLIILDLNMPKMNGLEFLQVLRADDRWRDTKVFVLTTSSENEDRRAASAHGISGYIVKPLKLNNAGSIDAFNLMIDLMNM
jgi:CheY-like chemotaxis protein